MAEVTLLAQLKPSCFVQRALSRSLYPGFSRLATDNFHRCLVGLWMSLKFWEQYLFSSYIYLLKNYANNYSLKEW